MPAHPAPQRHLANRHAVRVSGSDSYALLYYGSKLYQGKPKSHWMDNIKQRMGKYYRHRGKGQDRTESCSRDSAERKVVVVSCQYSKEDGRPIRERLHQCNLPGKSLPVLNCCALKVFAYLLFSIWIWKLRNVQYTEQTRQNYIPLVTVQFRLRCVVLSSAPPRMAATSNTLATLSVTCSGSIAQTARSYTKNSLWFTAQNRCVTLSVA